MRLTYAKCAEMIGNRPPRRKLKGNTWLVKDGDSYAVSFHGTGILRYQPDGTVTVTTGGFRTVTTKARLNEYGPFPIWQEKGIWYFELDGQKMEYQDYLTFTTYPDGSAERIDETAVMSSDPEEMALVLATQAGDCPAGVVTDWRKEKGLIPV